MKFGFINIGKTQRFSSFIAILAKRGYHLYFAHNYTADEDIDSIGALINACDVVFVAAERMKFGEIFNLTEIGERDTHYQIGAILYVFLDDITSIQNAERIIREYYTRLNIRMSVYRIFLEKGCPIDSIDIFDPKNSKVADKYSLSKQLSGSLLDIIIRYRNDSRIANLNKQILDSYFNYIYSTNLCPLSELISSTLIKHNAKIRLAESFTGGRLASSLTEMAGASSYLIESVVAYADSAKMDRLNVQSNVLAKQGAVSAEAAFEMARSLMKSGCDIAVSTTGNAGPTAQNGGKVGKCFIAVAVPGKIEVNEYDFSGSREEITECGVTHAQFLLYRKLKMAYN